jgi:hypothetical protein
VLGLGAAFFVATRTPKPPKPPSASLLGRHGCTLRSYPSVGRKHVSASRPPEAYTIRYARPGSPGKSLDGTTVTYDSFPPTSGPHYPKWTTWGAYSRPVLEIQAVHNLEHGGIVIQYGRAVPAATVARIRRFYDGSPNGMLLAPLPALGARIALSAWTYVASCSGFDAIAFTAFRDAFRFKGPERFPASALAPGR